MTLRLDLEKRLREDESDSILEEEQFLQNNWTKQTNSYLIPD